MSERVSVASEEKPGGLVVESVALIAAVVVRDHALALSGVWLPSAAEKAGQSRIFFSVQNAVGHERPPDVPKDAPREDLVASRR